MRNVSTSRIAAVAALIVGVAAAAVILFGGGNDYVVKARMVDAGQLVKGGLVLVAGRPVGKVTDIRLTQDNQAELVMTITDDNARPLRRGTVAQIRLVGLSGVTNRYVDLQPGPDSGEEIEDGGVLQQAETRPVVDLDTVLNALDEKTRTKLQVDHPGRRPDLPGNRAGREPGHGVPEPRVAQGRALFEELAYDTAAIGKLVSTGATVTSLLANRREDVGNGLTSTATDAPRDRQRTRLAAGRADARTAVLRRDRRPSRPRARPSTSSARPSARCGRRPSRWRRCCATCRRSRARRVPILDDLEALLPAARKAAHRPRPRSPTPAIPALKSTTSSVGPPRSIFDGLRPYAPDLIAGLFNGLGG